MQRIFHGIIFFSIFLSMAFLPINDACSAEKIAVDTSEKNTAPALDQTLRDLRAASRKAKTSSLYVWRDGKVLIQDYDKKGDQLVSIQSITKSVVSLAIGKLVADGKITSIDDPVQKYLPEFTGNDREKITLRQVLTHQTGFDPGANFGLDVESSKDFIADAIAQKPVFKPGKEFRYDNRGIQLAGAVVTRVSGRELQEYVRDEIFMPLKITQFKWAYDPAGNTVSHADLELRASDLAKIGMLVMDRGKFENKQIIAESWFDVAMPKQFNVSFSNQRGIWWNLSLDENAKISIIADDLAAMQKQGLSEDLAKQLLTLDGITIDQFIDQYVVGFTREQQMDVKKLRIAANANPIRVIGGIDGFSSSGGGGQYLSVHIDSRTISIRMIAPNKIKKDSSTAMSDFLSLTSKLSE
jgi:CubicO group peptidase (beta-lactamase class C family)